MGGFMRCAVLAAALLWAGAAVAEDAPDRFLLGGDAFLAGQTAVLNESGRDDAFLAGERVRLEAAIDGTAHMAGRWVEIVESVGDSLYAAGQEVAVRGPVAQDATLAAQRVEVRAPVGGDLRAFGSEVTVTGGITGNALIGAEFVQIGDIIAGDLALAARSVKFGPGARVDGALILFEDDPGALAIPERVAPADRIERRAIEEWDEEFGDYSPVGPRFVVMSFLSGVLMITILAAGFAALAPRVMARLRETVLAHVGRSLLTGFVAVSALIGAGVLVALTLIGLLLTPAMILAALLAGVAGYIVGAYALGVWITGKMGAGTPDDTMDRALAAGVGALAAGILGLVPFLGWLFVLALSLTGAGAVALRWLRPRFFTDA